MYVPLQIDISVIEGFTCSKLGLTKGDKILAINNKKVVSFNEFQIELGRVEDVLASAETPQDSARALTAQVTLSSRRFLMIPSVMPNLSGTRV